MKAKARIVRIGNSRGIRVPKGLLQYAELPDHVELHAEKGRLIVRPARGRREGWATLAKTMRERGDDELLDAATSSRFDTQDWDW